MIKLVGRIRVFIAYLVASVALSHLQVLHAYHVLRLRHVSHDAVGSIVIVHILRLVESIDLAHEILELAVVWDPEVVWATNHVLLLVLHLAHSLI